MEAKWSQAGSRIKMKDETGSILKIDIEGETSDVEAAAIERRHGMKEKA